MKRMTTLIAGVLTLIAFAATANTASADMGEYARGMEPFVPAIERWAYEARELSTAAVAKPELACSAEMAEMALRGRSIADDLDGMTRLTPKFMVLTHVTVAREVRGMAEAADMACYDASTAAEQIDAAYDDFAGPMKRIRTYVSRASRFAR